MLGYVYRKIIFLKYLHLHELITSVHIVYIFLYNSIGFCWCNEDNTMTRITASHLKILLHTLCGESVWWGKENDGVKYLIPKATLTRQCHLISSNHLTRRHTTTTTTTSIYIQLLVCITAIVCDGNLVYVHLHKLGKSRWDELICHFVLAIGHHLPNCLHHTKQLVILQVTLTYC